jgi:16S rRNA processing protein RimM
MLRIALEGRGGLMAERICVAKIGAAHGVRGEVRLWTFTEDPLAVTRYGPLSTKDGTRQFEVTKAREARDHLVATLKGIDDRTAAEKLNGVELYIARDQLPATDDDEYYHSDLIGLAAETTAGEPLGRVIAMHNFGAGDIIEIAPPAGSTLLLPFSNAVVPTVDVKGGRVIIELPAEIEGDERDDDDDGEESEAASAPSARGPRERGDP